jgi:hypothetical protein
LARNDVTVVNLQTFDKVTAGPRCYKNANFQIKRIGKKLVKF